MSLYLAFDVGPQQSAWALVSSPSTVRGFVRWINGGMVLSDRSSLYEVLVSVAEGTIVGVEVPSVVHPSAGGGPGAVFARAKQLLATAKVAGMIAEMARGRGLRVLEITASQWRRGVCGKGNSSDTRIKQAVTRYTTGLPARNSAHVRDALGLAICLSWNSKGST